MIVPSVDIQNGRAVQLRHGREFVLDGGDPMDRVAQFAVAGDVAVVDLDAATGGPSNHAVIRPMVRRYACRVGGGIRDLASARAWLDAGAAKIVVGTAATPEFMRALPRDRIVAAVDADRGTVVVDGWRERTADHVLDRIRALAPFVGGFLLTQVDREGDMAGFDMDLLRRAEETADGVRITAAGGITTGAEIAQLDAIGIDAQVGMALYTGRLSLGQAVSAVLRKPVDGQVWPTIVREISGASLGLVWSTRESVAQAVDERRGVYWSRSRNCLWLKGDSSGNIQDLIGVRLDCDRDALEFVVRQHGEGFCHTGTRSCFGTEFSLDHLERTIHERIASNDPQSGTVKLAADRALLNAKLHEEANELASACSPDDTVHEAADLLYFTLVTLASRGMRLEDVRCELARRHGRATRRPMTAKPDSTG